MSCALGLALGLAGASALGGEVPPATPAPAPAAAESLALEIEEVLADGKPVAFSPEGGVTLPAGRHDLEFRFRTRGQTPTRWMVRHHLEGYDQTWHTASGEMETTVRLLDANGRVVNTQVWTVGGSTMRTDAKGKPVMTKRTEPVFVPAEARWIELEFNSGPQPDIQGLWIVDDLAVGRSGGSTNATKDLWRNSGFAKLDPATLGDAISPSPLLWERLGDPEIARMIDFKDDYAMTLRDNNAQSWGAWRSRQPLPEGIKPGEVLTVAWEEMYQVGDPKERVVRYRDVPPGKMRFQAIGCGDGGVWLGVGTTLAVVIEPYLWSRPWFWPLVAALGAAGLTLTVWGLLRWRYQRRLERLKTQHALERDRMRIARDIHDDVGAQLTRLTLLSALVNNNLSQPEKLRPQVEEIATASRQLVHSMNEIVWAVDPRHDSLDDLGTYLCRFTDDFLDGSGVRALYDIPPLLPAVPLQAEVRHNLFLAVKEALNNALKHSGCTEVRIAVSADKQALAIRIADNGAGFTVNGSASGHGLLNMRRRLEEIGGTCRLESTPGTGTQIHFSWPLKRATLG
jgi:signal transduction histidine kinase